MDQDIVAYVILANDVGNSFTPGKKMAQVHHAGVQMAVAANQSGLFAQYIKEGQASLADNFSTTIVLAANQNTIDQMIDLIAVEAPQPILFGTVTDPEYPFPVEGEIVRMFDMKPVADLGNDRFLCVRVQRTCMWVLMSKNHPLRSHSAWMAMNLHP